MKARRHKRRVMFVFGTRPEVIKLAPLIKELHRHPDVFSVTSCFTAQHNHTCEPLLRFFSIRPRHDLNVMTERQSLVEIATRTMERLDKVLASERVELLVVQGDTTSALAAAMTAFYRNIPVAHVEAGLRTHTVSNPYPEEMNRQLIDRIALLNFAPTKGAARALAAEGIGRERVFITGNTVIDALDFTLARHRWRVRRGARRAPSGRKRILVTAHRRESFGAGIDEICAAITDIVERDDSVEIVLPMHPNPEVRIPVQRALSANPRIRLSPPLDYPDLIALMRRSSIVLTDSGGLQEEAPALGVPVVVMRDSTERPEIIEAGGAVLAGPHRRTIVAEVERILSNRDVYEKMSRVRRPFGDGHAAARIRRIIYAWFQARSPHGIRSIRKKVEYHP